MYKIAEQAGYQTVLIESPEEKTLAELLAPSLRQIALKLDLIEGKKEKSRKVMSALRSFASAFKVNIGDRGFGVEPSHGTADSGVIDRDLIDLLVAVGEAAAEAKGGVALFIDELQYVEERELGALIAGIHRVGQLNLPLVVFGA